MTLIPSLKIDLVFYSLGKKKEKRDLHTFIFIGIYLHIYILIGKFDNKFAKPQEKSWEMRD